MNKRIEITVSGVPGSGKTSIAYEIYKLLDEHLEFDKVIVHDEDIDLRYYDENMHEKRMLHLKDNVCLVLIKTEYAKRED